jgi:hypothetical protein
MTPIEELTAREMAEVASAAKEVEAKAEAVLKGLTDTSTQPPEVLQVAVLDPTSATPNAFKIQTVNELAETTNAAKAVEDQRVADAQVAVSNQPAAVPPDTVIVATSAVQGPVPVRDTKPSFGSRVKAELQVVEDEVKKIATEIEDAV